VLNCNEILDKVTQNYSFFELRNFTELLNTAPRLKCIAQPNTTQLRWKQES